MFTSSRNSNGLARSERHHRIVNETLKLMVDHDTKDWDQKLPFVEHHMRNKTKDGGFSPYQMRHGKRMRVYNQITFKGDISEDEKRFPVAREYMKKLRYSLHDMWNQYDMWSVEAQCKVWAEVGRFFGPDLGRRLTGPETAGTEEDIAQNPRKSNSTEL